MCSELDQFYRCWEFFRDTVFTRRGYDRSLANKTFQSASRTPRARLLLPSPTSAIGRPSPPFVFPCTTATDIPSALQQSFPCLSTEDALRHFTGPQQAVFTKGITLGGLLCRASLQQRPPLPKGCALCALPCCPLDEALQPCSAITSTAAGATFPAVAPLM